MAAVTFTAALGRYVDAPPAQPTGGTVREVFETYFRSYPQVRSYVLDDQGAVRKHVAIFLNGVLIRDRVRLTDVVGEADEIYVVQALSGG